MKRLRLSLAVRAAILCAITGGMWLVLSYLIAAAIFHNSILPNWIQTYRGWSLVAVTSIVLFAYLTLESRRHKNSKKNAADVFEITLESQREETAQEALYQIASATVTASSLDELYRAIHNILARIMPADNFYIAIYDKDTNLLSFPYFVDEYDSPPELPTPPGHGLTEYVLRTQTPLLASPQVFDQLVKEGDVETIGVPSLDWLGVPLPVSEKSVGVMAVQTYEEGTRYGQRELSILQFVSSQVAMAIQRKQAAEKLQDSEEQYRLLTEHSPYSVVVHIEGKIVYVNEAGVRLMGAGFADELLGKAVIDFVHPDSRSAVIERFRLLEEGSELPPLVEKFIRCDGAIIDVEITAYPFKYQEKQAIQVVGRDITEQKHAELQLRRQLTKLTILHAAAKAASQSTNENELIEQTIRTIVNILHPSVCSLLLLNRNGDLLIPHPSCRGIDPKYLTVNIPLSKGITGRVVTTGRAIRCGDVTADPDYFEVAPSIHSELSVPLRVNDRIIGVINVESTTPNAYDQEDEELFTTLADGLGTAIERVRLFEAERQRRQEAEKLRQAATAITSSLNLQEVLDLLLVVIKGVVPYDSASILLPADNNNVRIVAARGLPYQERDINRSFPSANLLLQHIYLTGQPLILEDAQKDSRFEKWAASELVRGWMGIPMIAHGKVIGFITLDSFKVSAYDAASAMLAQAFAHQAAVAIENAQLFENLQQAYDTTLEGWGNALELRDKVTEGHTQRVAEMTLELARRLGFSGDQLTQIRRGVLVHDIGKMGVPDRILRKKGSLTKKEWEEMRRHPQYAFDLLHPIAYLRPALDIAYCHHEHWNGKGYPRGLKGEQIPIAARIFAVVDVWDALISDRPYRKAWPPKKAVKYIREQAGSYFDPAIVEIFLKMIEEKK